MSSGSANASADSSLAELRTDLRVGLRNHLPYAGFAAAVVLFSLPIGFTRSGGGSSVPFGGLVTPLFPQERPVLALVGSEMDLFSLLVIGAVSLGALTLLGLVAQGVVTGYLIGLSVGSLDPGWLFVALVPHGLFKLGGFALAAAVSFRLVHCGFGLLVGTRSQFLDYREWRQTGIVLCAGWLCLLAAALVEVYLTPRLLGVIF